MPFCVLLVLAQGNHRIKEDYPRLYHTQPPINDKFRNLSALLLASGFELQLAQRHVHPSYLCIQETTKLFCEVHE